jgi:hypothetical protein
MPHAVHDDAPADDTWPDAHGEQRELPALENVPVGHVAQSVEPLCAAKRPGRHEWHTDMAREGVNLPAGHAAHASVLNVGACVPAGHARSVAAVFEMKPGGTGVQSALRLLSV